MRLIRKWLRVPILIKGKLVKRRKGVPQGSPISPLLSNILLHELDKELTRKGLKFVRYADDFSIYTKSKYQAKTVGNAIFLFLRDKLKLTIYLEKSGIRKPIQFTILGFSFASTYQKRSKRQVSVNRRGESLGKTQAESKIGDAQNRTQKFRGMHPKNQ